MKRIALKVTIVVFLFGAVGTLANGQITLGDLPGAVSNKAFTSTPVAPLKKGTVLASSYIMDNWCGKQSWGFDSYDFLIGGNTVTFPVIGLMDCSGSDSTGNYTVLASKTVFAVDIKAGELLHSGGYLIEAKRAIKAGETIPTLLFWGSGGDSFLSIEEAPKAEGNNSTAKPQPLLTIFDEHMKPNERTSVVGARWIAKKIVRETNVPAVNIPVLRR